MEYRKTKESEVGTLYCTWSEIIESLNMTLTTNGRRQKLNFLASVLSRLYTKVKIFAFTVNKIFLSIFLLLLD